MSCFSSSGRSPEAPSLPSPRRTVAVQEYSNNHESAQETNLFRNFAAQVQSGKLNHDWPEIALRTQQVMEACLASAHDEGRPKSP